MLIIIFYSSVTQHKATNDLCANYQSVTRLDPAIGLALANSPNSHLQLIKCFDFTLVILYSRIGKTDDDLCKSMAGPLLFPTFRDSSRNHGFLFSRSNNTIYFHKPKSDPSQIVLTIVGSHLPPPSLFLECFIPQPKVNNEGCGTFHIFCFFCLEASLPMKLVSPLCMDHMGLYCSLF